MYSVCMYIYTLSHTHTHKPGWQTNLKVLLREVAITKPGLGDMFWSCRVALVCLCG